MKNVAKIFNLVPDTVFTDGTVALPNDLDKCEEFGVEGSESMKRTPGSFTSVGRKPSPGPSKSRGKPLSISDCSDIPHTFSMAEPSKGSNKANNRVLHFSAFMFV